MSESGRYTIVDQATGRKFVVEPIHERNEKATDRTFSNGGIDGEAVKNKPSQGGSISPEESTITPENGFTNITTLPAGVSPLDWINEQLKNDK